MVNFVVFVCAIARRVHCAIYISSRGCVDGVLFVGIRCLPCPNFVSPLQCGPCLRRFQCRWVPPVARAPPLTLTRLMADIRAYIVYRGGRGKGALGRLMSLFHRQFREVAHDRYVKGREVELHSNLADFFSGKYHAGKPYRHPKPEMFPDPCPDDRLLPGNALFVGKQAQGLPQYPIPRHPRQHPGSPLDPPQFDQV